MTWQGQLERLGQARGSLREAMEALEPMSELDEARLLLQELDGSLERRLDGVRRRVEALERVEERAQERQFRRDAL